MQKQATSTAAAASLTARATEIIKSILGDISRLAGDRRRVLRQELMHELTGKKTPVAKSGITAIETLLLAAAGIATSLTFTQTHVARSMQADQLMQLAHELDFEHKAQAAPDLPTALARVLPLVQVEDVICITGSLHLVAEAQELLDAAEA